MIGTKMVFGEPLEYAMDVKKRIANIFLGYGEEDDLFNLKFILSYYISNQILIFLLNLSIFFLVFLNLLLLDF
jgi:hypothetical protein